MKMKYTQCDSCQKLLEEDTSPPTKEAYENARIHVEEMSVLLPQSVVNLHTKEGHTELHALTITDADFCDVRCLSNFIQRYMKGEPGVKAYCPSPSG